jgi:hypothetical protein
VTAELEFQLEVQPPAAPSERGGAGSRLEFQAGIPTVHRGRDGGRWVWWAALVVTLCGVAATAHGLYAVVLACKVPAGIAGLYVPITDGLAMVAYVSTDRLRGIHRAYAWLVVVVAAGLSGLAQATFLAGLGDPSWKLRFGVGYWPAVAVAVAVHLLWLAGRPGVERARVRTAEGASQGASAAEERAHEGAHEGAHAHPAEGRMPAWSAGAPAGRALLPIVACGRMPDAPAKRPAAAPRTRDELAARRKVKCDCGCAQSLSKSQRTRHRKVLRASNQ